MILRHPLFPGKSETWEPWHTFVSNNVNYHEEWDPKKQEKWGRLCLLAVQRSVYWLECENLGFKSLNDIYHLCAKQRRKIAAVLGHGLKYGVSRFGKAKEKRVSTFDPERLRNKGQFEELKEKFKKLANDGTTVTIILDGIHEPVMRLSLSVSTKGEKLKVEYPAPQIASQLMEKANKIWISAFDTRAILSGREKYFRLFQIMWYLALACPLDLGSAATSELTYHTLCHELKLPLLPLKSEKSWDIFAFFTSGPEEYAKWAMDNLLISVPNDQQSQFQLPSGNFEDDPADLLEQEAERLVAAATSDNGQIQYKNNNRKDCYGLSLLHYYIMAVYRHCRNHPHKKEMLRKALLPLVCFPDSNGNYMLIDAIRIRSSDPVQFLIEQNLDVPVLLRCLIVLQNNRSRDRIISWLDTIIFLYSNDNPVVVVMARNFKRYLLSSLEVDTYSQAFEVKHRELVYLLQVSALPFSTSNLICAFRLKRPHNYFLGLSVQDWITPRVELGGEALIDATIKINDADYVMGIFHTLEDQDMQPLLDYMLLSSHALLYLNIIIRAIDSDEFIEWIDDFISRHPQYRFLAIASKLPAEEYFVRENMNIRAIMSVVKDAEINQPDCEGKLPLYNAYQTGNHFLIECLLMRHARVGCNILIDQSLGLKIRDYLFSVANGVGIKLSICSDLSAPEIAWLIRNVVIDAWEIRIAGFCQALNLMMRPPVPCKNTPVLFSPSVVTRKDLKPAVIEALCNLATQQRYKELSLFLINLNNLGFENYGLLKIKLEASHSKSAVPSGDYNEAVGLVNLSMRNSRIAKPL